MEGARTLTETPEFGEVESVAGVAVGMREAEVVRHLGQPRQRTTARSIWGPAASTFYQDPDVVETWLYDLVEHSKSLMVVVEGGRVRTLHLQRLR